jgi:electron transport complex protein RnfG
MSEAELAHGVPQEQEPSSLRLVATLGVAGLISGLLLATVFEITRPIIERNNAIALERAVYKVVPGSSTMRKLVVRDGKLSVLDQEGPIGEPVVYGAYDENRVFLGYAIENNGPGFQDTIRLLYGYDRARNRVIGLEILESRETPGLGDKIYKDARFAANFRDLAVEPEIVVVKGGRTADNEVDAITGATISSKAVVRIINAANVRWLGELPAAGEEPVLPEPPPAPDTEEQTAAAASGRGEG